MRLVPLTAQPLSLRIPAYPTADSTNPPWTCGLTLPGSCGELSTWLRRYASHPFHGIADPVMEGFNAEGMLYQPGPRKWLRAGPSLLSENGKHRIGRKVYLSRSKQPKASNRMFVSSRDVLSPPLNKLFKRASHFNLAAQLFVFVPKCDSSVRNQGNAVFRDGRPSDVASGVLDV
jgi:hypothetical protein